MARYKGKREAPRQELFARGHAHEREGREGLLVEEEIFQEETVFDTEVVTDDAMDDVFVRTKEPFFRTRTGRVLTVVGIIALVLIALVVAVVLIWKSNVKPPELPNVADDPTHNDVGNQNNVIGNLGNNSQNTVPDEPVDEPPTDDELYPDDGYVGEVPAVSGSRKEGVYTFLLVGTDKDDGNTDTIMVVSYDTAEQDINVMSIPRDTMINESWDIKKINSVYSRTGGNINSLANRVQKLVGFKPDFYVKVDLSMFVELVDLVGGVEFYVPQDMDYEDPWQDLYIHLKEGQQVLDGEKAMQLVRFRRYDEGDIKRVQVQQDFLKALIKECISLEHWGKIKAYIELGLDHVQTDLKLSDIIWFAANVMGLNEAPMLSMDDVYTCTIPGNYFAYAYSRAVDGNQSYVTVYANQTVKLVNERFNPYTSNVTTGNLDIMSILDNGDIASSTGYVKDQEHNQIMAVRRGEAYYDAQGNFVMGQPSDKPEVHTDEFGNYYIYDAEGTIIFTDENGTPLDPGDAGDEDQPADQPVDQPTDQPVNDPQPPVDQPADQPVDEPVPPEDQPVEPEPPADGNEPVEDTEDPTAGDEDGEEEEDYGSQRPGWL